MTKAITVGSRVRISVLADRPGTVAHISPEGEAAVEVDVPFSGHTCRGLVPSDRGWFVMVRHLTLDVPFVAANPSATAPVFPRFPVDALNMQPQDDNPVGREYLTARLPTMSDLKDVSAETIPNMNIAIYTPRRGYLGYNGRPSSGCLGQSAKDHWIISEDGTGDNIVRSRFRSMSGNSCSGFFANPWASHAFWKDNIGRLIELLPVPSRAFPGKISIFASASDRLRDRETAMKAGRFLRRYLGDLLTEQQIQDYGLFFEQQCAPVEAKFATDADDIQAIYLGGPDSCMSKRTSYFDCSVHPSRVFAGPDLAVAYLGDLNDASARAVVWPDKKLYATVYGDTHRLISALEQAGFTESDDFRGARVQRIEEDGRFVMPYLDMSNTADVEGDYLVLKGDRGDIGCQETDGYADHYDDSYERCAFSGERCHVDEMTYIDDYGHVSDAALDEYFTRCPISDEYVRNSDTSEVRTARGSILVSDDIVSCGEYVRECTGSGDLYLVDVPHSFTGLETVEFVQINDDDYSIAYAKDHAFICDLTGDWFLNAEMVTLTDGSTVSQEAFDDLDEDDQASNPIKDPVSVDQLELTLAA